MQQFAISEIYSLLGRLPSPMDDRDPVVRYICALFSELAYYHIPQWEIDDRKRAKLIPCDAYKLLAAQGRPTNLGTLLQQMDMPRRFVVANRSVVAVGIVLNKMLFIGFRGTQFLFDWKVNLRSSLVPVHSRFRIRPSFISGTACGKLHSGFGEEAIRISARILDAIRDANFDDIDHIFLTGHSLGGAVAAISENFLRVAPTSVSIFGAPRYCDFSAYATLPNGPPSQIRRPGDVVPTVPPKAFGYADHPYEFGTNGAEYVDPAPYSSAFGEVLRWGRFLFAKFEPHSIEAYRFELGATAGASAASLPLAPVENLTREDIGAK